MATASTTIWMTFTGRENIGECPNCHFDSLERFTFTVLVRDEVHTKERIVCPRCRDAARTED